MSRPGLCETCGEREASRHLRVERSGEEAADHYLCTECLRRREARELQFGDLSLNDLLGHLILADPEATFYCAGCGFDLEDLVRTGRTGCPECYSHFRGQIESMLRGSIGRLRHQGKHPPPS